MVTVPTLDAVIYLIFSSDMTVEYSGNLLLSNNIGGIQ